MLIFFFILIFIAEVKITYDVVCFIKKLDMRICKINEDLSSLNPVIDSSFTSLRIALNKALLALNKVQLKIKEKKEEYKIIILKNIITGILFFILNTKAQKIFSVVDLAFDIKEFYKKWSKIA
jgi:hypothetical protein